MFCRQWFSNIDKGKRTGGFPLLSFVALILFQGTKPNIGGDNTCMWVQWRGNRWIYHPPLSCRGGSIFRIGISKKVEPNYKLIWSKTRVVSLPTRREVGKTLFSYLARWYPQISVGVRKHGEKFPLFAFWSSFPMHFQLMFHSPSSDRALNVMGYPRW